jgi:hypothetical protein
MEEGSGGRFREDLSAGVMMRGPSCVAGCVHTPVAVVAQGGCEAITPNEVAQPDSA